MGKLIKNHWARLIILTAAIYQIAAAGEGFFWPKIFFEYWTKAFDPLVTSRALQAVNLIQGIFAVAFEWPVPFLTGNFLHRSIAFRLILYPLFALSAVLMYQATNPAIYYCVGMGVYFWAYSSGEVICPEPWTLPKRQGARGPTKA